MPLMGKDLEIEEYDWLADVGLASDQIAHVWTYTRGETVPETGEWREIGSGRTLQLIRGSEFPEGRWVAATDLPGPRFKQGTDSEEVTT